MLFMFGSQRPLKERNGRSPRTAVQESFRLHELPLRDSKSLLRAEDTPSFHVQGGTLYLGYRKAI